MTPKKDNNNQNFEERNRTLSSDYKRVNGEDNLDTRKISHDIEEEEDYDDEELTEDDFKIDEDENEDENIE